MLEEVFFKGEFISKFLCDELDRISSALSSDLKNEDDIQETYRKLHIEPLEISEEDMTTQEFEGYRDRNPFLQRPATKNSPYAIKCKVVEYKIPYEGDRRLFRVTTSPFPFYPFGRLEEDHFVFRIMEEKMDFLNDIDYQMTLLRLCVDKCKAFVKCFNSDLMDKIRASAEHA